MGEGSAWPTTAVTLLTRLRDEQDQDAWNTFVQVYMPLIYRYCCRRGLQDADAGDVTQMALQRVLSNIRKFDYDPNAGKFRAWLGTLTRNVMHDFLGKQRRAGQGAGGEVAQELLSQLEDDDDSTWTAEFNAVTYEAAIDQTRPHFTPEEWRAFDLVWIQQHKPVDVAGELNRKPDWVYKTKYRVLQRLKSIVEYLVADSSRL